MFEVLEAKQFKAFIEKQRSKVKREISIIQHHHTYKPDYAAWEKRPVHEYWIRSMHEHHVKFNGWAEIGQHFTTFPDGKIGVCRSIEKIPACIPLKNKTAICIEHLGNFDSDQMTVTQKHTIVSMTATLVQAFGIKIDTDHVIYHHWHSQKSCPGSKFFGGNSKTHANEFFYPMVRSELPIKKRMVIAELLNIRSGPGADFVKVGHLNKGQEVQVFETRDSGWVAIDVHKNRWVSEKYLGPEYY